MSNSAADKGLGVLSLFLHPGDNTPLNPAVTSGQGGIDGFVGDSSQANPRTEVRTRQGVRGRQRGSVGIGGESRSRGYQLALSLDPEPVTRGRLRITTHKGGGYVWAVAERTYLHRLVVARMLGRPLRSDEHAHHVNGDRLDNRPSNLEVKVKPEHARHHGRLLAPRRRRDSAGRWIAGLAP